MAEFYNYLVGVLIVIGAAFALVAAIGLVRLPDFYSRTHAASKAGTNSSWRTRFPGGTPPKGPVHGASSGELAAIVWGSPVSCPRDGKGIAANKAATVKTET